MGLMPDHPTPLNEPPDAQAVRLTPEALGAIKAGARWEMVGGVPCVNIDHVWYPLAEVLDAQAAALAAAEKRNDEWDATYRNLEVQAKSVLKERNDLFSALAAAAREREALQRLAGRAVRQVHAHEHFGPDVPHCKYGLCGEYDAALAGQGREGRPAVYGAVEGQAG